MRTVYIAGPMKGIPLFNFPAFDAARDMINNGWGPPYRALSPADIDRRHGFDPATLPPDHNWNVIPIEAGSREEIMRRDINALLSADAIFMLPGKAELHLARWANKNIYHHKDAAKPHRGPIAEQANYVEPPRNQTEQSTDSEDVLDIAARITRGDRQSSYGPPDQDFRRTAEMITAMLRHKLAEGQQFETWEIAQMMILLKLSRLQHSKKRDNVVDIAGYARCMDVCYDAAGGYQA